ncbi:MAG: formylglycine-generating enzyme family protein [Bacteroidales bacterium]|nr:formylglycine-generating enzyme family protein [Bacteroidales bacterium]
MKHPVYLLFSIAFILLSFLGNAQGISEEDKQWLINKTKESLVFVEGGTFMMGDEGYVDSNGVHHYFTGDRTSRPAHKVTLDSYSIMKYEITFKEFDLFTNATGQELVGKKYRTDPDMQPNLSVKMVTWQQSQDYCKWIGELISLPTSLPTEAQWEYAARSRGKAVKYATDNGELELNRNYKGDKYPWYGTPPGTFPPNPLGLYDMTGNKPEWVLDWYHVYNETPKVNPVNMESGATKVVRGFPGIPEYNASPIVSRGTREPDNTGTGIGFRCVCNSSKPINKL